MTSSDRILLYVDDFWISPYAFSVYVALKEKGLPFETRAVALQRKEQKNADYLERSLTGRVPALEHGDFSLAESSAIIEYLEDVYPPPKYPRLLPEAPRDRARARQIMAWIRSDLMPIREERATTTMFYERASKPLSAQGEEAKAKLIRVASALVREGKTTLFGAYSSADSDLAFMLQRLILNGHEVPAKVRAFADAQWARPAVREFVDRKRPAYEPY